LNGALELLLADSGARDWRVVEAPCDSIRRHSESQARKPLWVGVAPAYPQYLRSDFIQEMIQEFQSPNFRNENQLQYEALVGLMAAAIVLSRRRVTGVLILSGPSVAGSIRHIAGVRHTGVACHRRGSHAGVEVVGRAR
jgi:hypothetical protein